MAQVNLALVKGCALANATGILLRDGMLYFFVQKGSLQMNPENAPGAHYSSFFLQAVPCCVVHYAGSSGWAVQVTRIKARVESA